MNPRSCLGAHALSPIEEGERQAHGAEKEIAPLLAFVAASDAELRPGESSPEPECGVCRIQLGLESTNVRAVSSRREQVFEIVATRDPKRSRGFDLLFRRKRQ
jgi:hypothetical protein